MPQESISYFFRNIFRPDGSKPAAAAARPTKEALNKLHLRSQYMPVITILFCTFVTFFIIPRIPQPQFYHYFADKRPVVGLPFILNVISGIVFFWVGLRGIARLTTEGIKDLTARRMYRLFFTFTFIGGIGSAIYHLHPINLTLMFERMPLIIALMAVTSAVTSEIISLDVAKKMMWPLMGVGALTVLHWEYTELMGRGDLRVYGLAQILPLVLIPLMLLRTNNPPVDNVHLWRMVIFFMVSRFSEWFSALVYGMTFHLVSGYTFKDIFMALAVNEVMLHLKTKPPLEEVEQAADEPKKN